MTAAATASRLRDDDLVTSLDELLANSDPAMPANAPIPTYFTAQQEQSILSAQG